MDRKKWAEMRRKQGVKHRKSGERSEHDFEPEIAAPARTRRLHRGGSDDGQAYVWAVSSRRLTHVLPGEAGDVTLVRFVDDEHLVVAGADRTVRAVTLSK